MIKLPIISICILFLVLGCKKRESEKDVGKINHPPNKERKSDLIRAIEKINKNEEWDFYLSSNRPLPDKGKKYPVSIFISKGISKESGKSLIVVSKNRYIRKNSPIIAIKEINGVVDEVHVVKLGPNPRSHLLLTSSHKVRGGITFSTTTFWDLNGGKFKSLWSITHSYDPDYRETYNPPEFHYWDGDDDGVREIILTNSWRNKKKPPSWKYRWAVFSWNKKNREILPVRGLFLSSYKDQNPLWLTFSALEANKNLSETEVRTLFKTHAVCDSHDSLVKKIFFKKWKMISSPKIIEYKPNWCKVSIKTIASGIRYNIMFELNRDMESDIEKWLICRVLIFKITLEKP
jgi:hypothetical protein